ncbi:MAG: O-antigen ligase family protein, partial [Pyrinomonadaceae bacterium]
QIWSVTLRVISEHLPFGAGLGAFGQAYTQADSASGFERVEQAHNDYLQIVADAGLVGLVLGGLFLFLIFREGKRNIAVKNKFRRGVAAGAIAGIFAILIHSLFDFVLHITAISVLFLTLMALLVASGRDYEDDVTDFEDERSFRRRKASVTPLDRRQIN